MHIEILNPDGTLNNTIEADEVSAEQCFPGAWRIAADQPQSIEIPIAEPPPPPTLDQAKATLTAQVTALRWQHETGGIALPDGTRVGTTLDDQNRITSVIANASLAGVTSVDFKSATGWVTLSLAQVQGIAAAIAIHVQAGFSAERAHHVAIAALTTLDETAVYDITTGWPN